MRISVPISLADQESNTASKENSLYVQTGWFLQLISIIYLAFPVLIFAFGWMKTSYALVTGLCIVLPILLLIREKQADFRAFASSAFKWIKAHGWHFSSVLFLIVLLTLLVGIGGVGYQTADWAKHNAILKDLSIQSWPVHIESEGGLSPLVYYFAYYLPATLIGKFVSNWVGINLALLLWSLLGLGLSVGWFAYLVRRFGVQVFLLFAFFSGLDVLGILPKLIWQFGPSFSDVLNTGHLDWWAVEFQYSSNATLLSWVPQHALAGWILAGLLIHLFSKPQFLKMFWFIVGVSLLWSPFVAFGLLIFFVAGLWHMNWKFHSEDFFSSFNIAGIWLVLVFVAYYSSLISNIDSKSGEGNFGITFLDPISNLHSGYQVILLYLLFVVAEVGIFSWIIWRNWQVFSLPERKLLIITLVFLAGLPVFRIGHYNDLVMRGSIPALFVVSIFLVRSMVGVNRLMKIIVLLIFALGAVTPFFEYRRQFNRIVVGDSMTITKQDMRSTDGLSQVISREDPFVRGYYMGDPKAWFFKTMTER
jgi:hypothetical protein